MNYSRSHSVETASAKAGFSTATGYRIKRDPTFPSRNKTPRDRRRPDPLAGVWDSEVVPMLEDCPGLRPVGILEEPRRRHPDPDPNVRRTLERRIGDWKAQHGPEKEVMFRQNHEPGRRLACLHPSEGVRRHPAGRKPGHMPCHFRLPWSGFRHAEVILGGESFTALAESLQAAPWQPGGAPKEHRAGYLSAGFRNHRKEDAGDMTKRYRLLCKHYRMKPSRNNRGVAHENGATCCPHGHPEREINDALALRGSREFADLDAYRTFIAGIVGRCNARRAAGISTERKLLNRLPNMRTTGHEETSVRVTSSSGFILKKVFCTVPLLLTSHRLGVRIHDDRLELCPGSTWQPALPRKRKGSSAKAVHVVDCRHVIHSLKTRPMALMNLVYRDELFPREAYRRCFETALKREGERSACRLTVKLPAPAHEENCEALLAAEIDACLQEGRLPEIDHLRARFAPAAGVMPAVSVTRATLPGHGDLPGMAGAS